MDNHITPGTEARSPRAARPGWRRWLTRPRLTLIAVVGLTGLVAGGLGSWTTSVTATSGPFSAAKPTTPPPPGNLAITRPPDGSYVVVGVGQQISGTGETNDSVSITRDGVSIGSGLPVGENGWSTTATFGSPGSNNTVTVTEYSNGTKVAETSAVYRAVDGMTLRASEYDVPVGTPVTLSGGSDRRATSVKVYEDGGTDPVLTADAAGGSWQGTIIPSEGKHAYAGVEYFGDSPGVTPGDPTATITAGSADTPDAAPAAPGPTPPGPTAPSAPVPPAGTTGQPQPSPSTASPTPPAVKPPTDPATAGTAFTLAGTADKSATKVEVFDNGGTKPIATAKPEDDGKWTAPITVDKPGDHTYSVVEYVGDAKIVTPKPISVQVTVHPPASSAPAQTPTPPPPPTQSQASTAPPSRTPTAPSTASRARPS